MEASPSVCPHTFEIISNQVNPTEPDTIVPSKQYSIQDIDTYSIARLKQWQQISAYTFPPKLFDVTVDENDKPSKDQSGQSSTSLDQQNNHKTAKEKVLELADKAKIELCNLYFLTSLITKGPNQSMKSYNLSDVQSSKCNMSLALTDNECITIKQNIYSTLEQVIESSRAETQRIVDDRRQICAKLNILSKHWRLVHYQKTSVSVDCSLSSISEVLTLNIKESTLDIDPIEYKKPLSTIEIILYHSTEGELCRFNAWEHELTQNELNDCNNMKDMDLYELSRIHKYCQIRKHHNCSTGIFHQLLQRHSDNKFNMVASQATVKSVSLSHQLVKANISDSVLVSKLVSEVFTANALAIRHLDKGSIIIELSANIFCEIRLQSIQIDHHPTVTRNSPLYSIASMVYKTLKIKYLDIFRQLIHNQGDSEKSQIIESQPNSKPSNDNFDEFLNVLKDQYRKRKNSDNKAVVNDPQKLLFNFVDHLCYLLHKFLLHESVKLNRIEHQFHIRRSSQMECLMNGNFIASTDDISIFPLEKASNLVGIVLHGKEIFYFQYSRARNILAKVLSKNWDFKSDSIQVDSIHDAVHLLLKNN